MLTVVQCPDPVAALARAVTDAEGYVEPSHHSLDVHVVLPDSGKWSVPELKAVGSEHLSTSPVGERKAVVLAQFDDVNPVAADVLLKKLEEPIPGVSTWLVTSSAQKIPVTLQSRADNVINADPRPQEEIIAAAGENPSPEWLVALASSVALWEVANVPSVSQVFTEKHLRDSQALAGWEAAVAIEESLKSAMKSKLPSGYIKQACLTWLNIRLTVATQHFPDRIPAILEAAEMLKVNINPKQALTYACM